MSLPETKKDVEYRERMRELIDALEQEINKQSPCIKDHPALDVIRRGRRLLDGN